MWWLIVRKRNILVWSKRSTPFSIKLTNSFMVLARGINKTTLLYQYRPYGVLKVVKCLSESGLPSIARNASSSKKWRFRGEGFLWQCLFRGDKSTERRGDPSCLRVMTMRWHHLVGSHKVPSRWHWASSGNRSNLIFSCQCNDTRMKAWV